MIKLIALLAIALSALGCASTDNKLHSMSTSELKLRHAQLAEEIAQPSGQSFSRSGGESEKRDDQINEKDKIESELRRRWQAGDKAAYLPQFPY